MKYNYVKELMTKKVISCETSATIKDAINLMKEYNIGFIPITKSNIIIGVVTDRDILIRSVGIYKSNTKIEKIMTNGEIHYVSPDTSLIEAGEKMATNKIRRLVVINDGKIVGILTSKDLLLEPSLLPYIVKTYLPKNHISEYSLYTNSNPHDSVKASDFPL